MLFGDLNADLTALSNTRSRTISASLAAFGLRDLLTDFKQRKPYRDLATWQQLRMGSIVKSRCDYVMGTDRRLVQTVGIRNPRHHSSDHYLIRVRLLRQPTKCHKRYLRGRRQWPLAMPPVGPLTEIDSLFQTLESYCDSPPPPPAKHRPQWLAPKTLQLMDARTTLRRDPCHCRRRARTLTRQINAAIKADRHRRAATAAEEIGAHLNNRDYQQAWNVCKRWYRHASARPPTPSRQDLTAISNNWRQLYTAERPSPPGPILHAVIEPFDVNDETPTEDEIKAAVKRIKSNRASGHSALRAEDFKDWLREAFPEEIHPPPERLPDPILARWGALVGIVQYMWNTGDLPTKLTWTILVLIPKGNGDYRGINLFDALWKLIDIIMDTRLTAAIQLQEFLHGFTARRGTSTATIQAKLAQ